MHPGDAQTPQVQPKLRLELQRPARKFPPKPFATEVARHGRWKLLPWDGNPVELFDTESDPTEMTNLLEHQPEIAAELESEPRESLAAGRDGSGKPR